MHLFLVYSIELYTPHNTGYIQLAVAMKLLCWQHSCTELGGYANTGTLTYSEYGTEILQGLTRNPSDTLKILVQCTTTQEIVQYTAGSHISHRSTGSVVYFILGRTNPTVSHISFTWPMHQKFHLKAAQLTVATLLDLPWALPMAVTF
jgi:hypothetical protein